ncbi:MAG: hypothetical protein VXX60_04385 [Bacteroidota bacterium]|nr:hypothetical protein [Bacteroidota bacterium]
MKHLSINLIAIFVASQTLLIAQTNLDQYKYVSVPNRFDFMKSSDQFQISSLAKFLLTKNKFTVLENLEKYPADLAANQCLLLNLNVEQIKGFLKTKLEVQFLNCKNQVVFKSDIGMSREKDFKTAYHQALRAAFSSVSEANYKFNETVDKVPTNEKPISVKRAVSTPMQDTDLSSSKLTSEILMTQTSYGFDIRDADGILVYSLYQTMSDGIYIIDKLPGIVYKRGNRFVREYISNQKIIIEPLTP